MIPVKKYTTQDTSSHDPTDQTGETDNHLDYRDRHLRNCTYWRYIIGLGIHGIYKNCGNSSDPSHPTYQTGTVFSGL